MKQDMRRITDWQPDDDFGNMAKGLTKAGIAFKIKPRKKFIRWRKRKVTQYALFRRV